MSGKKSGMSTKENHVSPVHAGQALESLRNSSFNTYSAIGEVIDNSIEADSKSIKIVMKTEVPKNKQKERVIEFAFFDDGSGMDKAVLHHCLQLGFSTSYNDRKGIGRFGVGMTLAAISLCRRIEVYSKNKGGDWKFTYLDLDELKEQNDPVIPVPENIEIPQEYRSIVAEPGTLVIWKKIDRVNDDLVNIPHWIGRTYRKFIANKIIENGKAIPNPKIRKIFFNGERIKGHDPLYATKNEQFPNGFTSKLSSEISIQYPIHLLDPPSGKSKGFSTITIRFALLPQQWRTKRGEGDSKDNKARYVPQNEGISILRNNREVFYGKLYPFKIEEGFRDLDRFWSCEISFNAELDHWFSVKNIKVGAQPLPELRKTLEENMVNTIMSYRKSIRKVWDEYDSNKNTKNSPTSGSEKAEKAVKKIIEGPKPIPPEEKEDDIDTVVDIALKKSAFIQKHKKEIKEKALEIPLQIIKDPEGDPRSPFIDITAEGNTTFLTINMKHALFLDIFKIKEDLENLAKKSQNENIIRLANMFYDRLILLLMTFALSRNQLSQTDTSIDSTIELIIIQWGHFLKRAIENIDEYS